MSAIETFGALVRDARLAAAISQQELAGLAGISVAALRDLEQGRVRRPRPATVDLLIAALGLTGDRAAALRDAAAEHPRTAPTRPTGPVRIDPGTADGPLRSGAGAARQRVAPCCARPAALSANTPVPATALVDMLWATLPAEPMRTLQTYVSCSGQRCARPQRSPGRRPATSSISVTNSST
ncbi:multiprotein-bridging factor 1 family protein [Luedemannella flava]